MATRQKFINTHNHPYKTIRRVPHQLPFRKRKEILNLYEDDDDDEFQWFINQSFSPAVCRFLFILINCVLKRRTRYHYYRNFLLIKWNNPCCVPSFYNSKKNNHIGESPQQGYRYFRQVEQPFLVASLPG